MKLQQLEQIYNQAKKLQAAYPGYPVEIKQNKDGLVITRVNENEIVIIYEATEHSDDLKINRMAVFDQGINETSLDNINKAIAVALEEQIAIWKSNIDETEKNVALLRAQG